MIHALYNCVEGHFYNPLEWRAEIWNLQSPIIHTGICVPKKVYKY